MERACIFIDGENLRFSVKELFPKDYKNAHYLPMADWKLFFETINLLSAKEMGIEESSLKILRSYWYVIAELSYDRFYKSNKKFNALPLQERLDYCKKFAPSTFPKSLGPKPSNDHKVNIVKKCIESLDLQSNRIQERFYEWSRIQSQIQHTVPKLQFQKFGYLSLALDAGYLDKGSKKPAIKLYGEKGVDVKLATDLINLKDIYDIAIIVSGDGDYIPAITSIKNLGKQVVVVDFKKDNGQFLPGGAKKLKEHSDFHFSISYQNMRKICRYDVKQGEETEKLTF